MRRDVIRKRLIELGESYFDIYEKFTEAGWAMGLRTRFTDGVWSLVPIDDESDLRFAEYLHETAEGYRHPRIIPGSVEKGRECALDRTRQKQPGADRSENELYISERLAEHWAANSLRQECDALCVESPNQKRLARMQASPSVLWNVVASLLLLLARCDAQ